MARKNIAIGSYVGTGAAINIELGFTPDHMRVINETDGDEEWEHFAGMTAGHALQRVAAGTASKITSNGFTPYAGVAGSAAKGMTVGTALSESGKTFRYIALREGV